MKLIIKENILKHFLVILCSVIFYPLVTNSFKGIDGNNFGNLMTIISILLVTVCFANFEFKYQSVDLDSHSLRFFSHLATFIFLLLTAVLLIMVCVGIGIVFPSMYFLILILSVLLYLSIVVFDFWDIFRRI